jgi:hypothetical protein
MKKILTLFIKWDRNNDVRKTIKVPVEIPDDYSVYLVECEK